MFDFTATLIITSSRLNPLDKPTYLLRCSFHKTLRDQEGVGILFDQVEVRISADALDGILLETELFDLVGRLIRRRRQNALTSSHSVMVAGSLEARSEPCHILIFSCMACGSPPFFTIAMM